MGIDSDAPVRPNRATWAEVNLNAIVDNTVRMKQLASTAHLMAVVKADGYGHGLEAAARAALAGGADWIGVALLDEAVHLRRRLSVPVRLRGDLNRRDAPWIGAWPDVPLLVLGPTHPAQARHAVAADVRLACDSLELIEALAAAAHALGRQAFVHIKVDTGMGRIGMPPSAVAEFLRRASGFQGVVVEGIFTHLADAENPDSPCTTDQLTAFRSLRADLEEAGLSPRVWHLANSAATMTVPGEAWHLVRPGISLYGYPPARRLAATASLQPALTWKARLAHSKVVRAGSCIGYGCTFRTTEPMAVGTVPVGYGDGFSRQWSNSGHVLVRGTRLPIIGHICMDQFMISLEPLATGALPANSEEVVLLGRQGDEEITAADLADGMGTIPYEVLCNIGHRVPRLYVWDGAVVGWSNMSAQEFSVSNVL